MVHATYIKIEQTAFQIITSSDGLSNIYDKHVTVYLPKASWYSALINGLVDKYVL